MYKYRSKTRKEILFLDPTSKIVRDLHATIPAIKAKNVNRCESNNCKTAACGKYIKDGTNLPLLRPRSVVSHAVLVRHTGQRIGSLPPRRRARLGRRCPDTANSSTQWLLVGYKMRFVRASDEQLSGERFSTASEACAVYRTVSRCLYILSIWHELLAAAPPRCRQHFRVKTEQAPEIGEKEIFSAPTRGNGHNHSCQPVEIVKIISAINNV